MDRWQREHAWVGLPLAVVYKLFADRALHLAALVTHYGFVSPFPMLLLFLAGTGLLDRRPALRRQLVQAVLQHFPAVGPDADRRAYRMSAEGRRFKGFATVSVDFGPGGRDSR